MRQIENPMVVDALWADAGQPEIKEKLNGAGYQEIGTGRFVADEDAFRFAMEQVENGSVEEEEFKALVVEWFYFGNWVHKEGGDAD